AAAQSLHDLEGDAAVEVRVVRGVDLAHAAAPERAQDLIAPDARARLQLPDERPAFVAGQAGGVAALFRGRPGHQVGAGAARREVRLDGRPDVRREPAAQKHDHRLFLQTAVRQARQRYARIAWWV